MVVRYGIFVYQEFKVIMKKIFFLKKNKNKNKIYLRFYSLYVFSKILMGEKILIIVFYKDIVNELVELILAWFLGLFGRYFRYLKR